MCGKLENNLIGKNGLKVGLPLKMLITGYLGSAFAAQKKCYFLLRETSAFSVGFQIIGKFLGHKNGFPLLKYQAALSA